MSKFLFSINVKQAAQRINGAQDLIEKRIVSIIEDVSIMAHKEVMQISSKTLNEYHDLMFRGVGKHGDGASRESSSHPGVDKRNKNVRWVKEAEGIWVVEIDDKVAWLETTGRPRTFMGEEWWLLKPGKSKVAKDGSTYRSIPMPQMVGKKPKFDTGLLGTGPGGDVATLIKKAAKNQGIKLDKIEKDDSGDVIAGPVDPETGLQGRAILHKLNVGQPNRQTHGMFFSRPRTQQESAAVNLSPHGGIYQLEGAVVTQKETSKGKFSKETIVFRTISSKHRADNRWFYPEIKPLNALGQVFEKSKLDFDKVMEGLAQEFNSRNEGQ